MKIINDNLKRKRREKKKDENNNQMFIFIFKSKLTEKPNQEKDN